MKQSFSWNPFTYFIWVLVLFLNYSQHVFAQGGNYGVNSPVAIGKFLNDSLPSLSPSNSSTEVDSWTVENAFPNIDFRDPLDMRHYPGTNRFLVAGKGGHIWTFENDPNASSMTMFLDLSDSVKIAGDGGLLGVIFHPEFGQAGSPNRGYVYVYYRFLHDRSISHLYQPAYLRLSRFTVHDHTPFQADPNSEFVMIQQYDQHEWHNGGSMFFGPLDSMLYLIVGDEGGANDQYESAQKLDLALMSGILRLDVDQRGGTISHPIRRQPLPTDAPPVGWPPTYSQGYYIPNDNPWVNPDSSVLEEFWAIGTRSPHRMWYDPPTGDIWFGDIGQGQREEVTIIHKGDNAQWPYREGFRVTGKPVPSPLIGTDTPPLLDYPRTDGSAVIGGIVYRGTKWANSLGGKYIFSDNVSQTIWTNDFYNSGSTQKEIITSIPFETNEWKDGVSHIFSDSVGEVYVLQLAGHRMVGGRIYKLVPESESVVPIQAPSLLSQTGAFSDLSTLTPSPGVIPYEPNITFWSDSSLKKRWIALPNDGLHDTQGEQIQFSENAEWTFPNGTVFIKHFDFPIDETTPGLTKKIETRFVIKGDDGIHYFLTYRWREDESEADLVSAVQGEDRILNITTATGIKQQTWHYPSNSECISCHNSASKQVLGMNTRQLNGDLFYPGTGNTANQLATMNHLDWFYPSLDEDTILTFSYLSPETETSESLEQRARSYLDVNCAYCHRPGGLQTSFDLRYTTPIANQGILNGNVGNNLGISGAKLVVPGDTGTSIVYQRLKSVHENVVMPPLAKNRIDEVGKQLIADWINSLDDEAPSIPQGLVAVNVTDTTIELSWNASTDNIEVTGYQIFQDGNSQAIASVDTIGMVVSGLSPLSTYIFAVAAYDSAGNISNQSASIAIQTLPADPCFGTDPVSITPAGPFAQDAGLQQLTATPVGGTWTGSADANGMFDPNLTPGTYEVYYSYDFGGGCTKADTLSITVDPPVDPCFGTDPVAISPAGPFAQDAGLQQLTASPLGGTWAGSADANGMFDPSTGVGSYEVYYSYDFGGGCTKSDTLSITVDPPVDPCFGTDTVRIDSAGPFAQDAGLQQLTASPLGGTWAGSADANGMFDPNVTPGTYEVYYSYDFGGGCTKSDTLSITVEAPVDPCFGTDTVRIDAAGPFAQDAGLQQLSASPLGGTWTGIADTNGMFDPNLTPGTYEVYYSYDFGGGCTKADTLSVTVDPPVDPCFGTDTVRIDSAGPFAQDAGMQQLTASPLGGTWAGSADANGMFDPNVTPGTYEVYYSYDFGGGCTKFDTLSITVDPPVDPCFGTDPVAITPTGPFAQDAGLQQLTASPLGGTWTGSADANGMFDPNVTPGTYEVYYSYDFGGGCTKSDTLSITVDPPVDPCFGTDPVSITPAGPFAQDAGLQQLTASPVGGIWAGSADANGMFDPSTGVGSYEVYYSYNFGGGCTKSDTLSITVDPPVDPCFGTDTVSNKLLLGLLLRMQDCNNSQLLLLGGTWAGSADVNGMFDPNLTPGTYEVYYSYDFGGGCTKSDTLSITVDPPVDSCFGTDTVSITPAGPFAQDAGMQQLTATPVGGTWAGSADTNGMFDPNLTPGTYEVYYSYDFGGGCTKSDTLSITVDPPVDPCFGTDPVSDNACWTLCSRCRTATTFSYSCGRYLGRQCRCKRDV